MLVGILTSGCSSPGDTDSSDKPTDKAADSADILKEAKEMGSREQAEALADGHVSSEEMAAALKALEVCLSSTHFHLESVYPDPIRGEPHFNYSVVPDRPDRDSGELDDCDIRTYRFVEMFAQVIQGSGPMDPAIRARTQACLDDAGVRTSVDDRTDKEIFITASKKNMGVVEECMRAAHRAEFPEQADISIFAPQEFGPG
jgi:hypothetical protein